MRYASLGILYLNISVNIENKGQSPKRKPMMLKVGVIDLSLPLLLSEVSLISMDALLDLKRNQLISPGNMICQSKNSNCGHSELVWEPLGIANTDGKKQCSEISPMQCKDVVPICNPTNDDNNEEMNASLHQVRKLHNHLGQADIHTLRRIVKQDGFKNTRQSIEQAIASCPCGNEEILHKTPFCRDIKLNILDNVCVWGYILSVG